MRESDPTESAESGDVIAGPSSGLNLQEVVTLIGVFESRFSFLLLQLIKLIATIKRKPRWGKKQKTFWKETMPNKTNLIKNDLVCYSTKDEELLKTYKNVYSKVLRAEKNSPLVSRVKLYLELLEQLTLGPESVS